MDIQPRNVTFWKLIEGRLFRIPQYQRAYSWTSKQREDLFSDIRDILAKDRDFHFMATIVGLRRNSIDLGTDRYDELEVVDGQQRITTLILLLKAIARHLPDPSKDKRDLDDKLLKEDNHTLLLLQTNHDYSNLFRDYLRSGHVPDSRSTTMLSDRAIAEGIKDAELFVESWPEDTNTPITDLLRLIKNNLHFVLHEIEDEAVVYTVFEVLNSRGLPVASLDRCKAMLMGVAFEDASNRRDVIEELHSIWERLYRVIGLRQGLGTEVMRFAATLIGQSRHSRVLRSEDALETLRHHTGGKATAARDISRWLLDVASAIEDLRNIGPFGVLTDIAQVRLLAVSIKLKGLPAAEERFLLDQWERTSFRIFGMCNNDARTAVGEYVRLACRLQSDPDKGKATASTIMYQLKQIGADYYTIDDAVQALENSDCYHEWQAKLRYILFEFEKHLAEQKNQTFDNAAWKKIWASAAADSVEHIFPQNPKRLSDWNDIGKAKPTTRSRLTHRIGNLVVLPPKENSRVGNGPFSKKMDLYQRVGLLVTREVADYGQWDRKAIEARESKILEWARWRWADVN